MSNDPVTDTSVLRSLSDSASDIVHTDAREGDIERSVADRTKSREQLGFEPKAPLEPGLAELARNREEHA
jgi:UDP-glucose 4-epimerase